MAVEVSDDAASKVVEGALPAQAYTLLVTHCVTASTGMPGLGVAACQCRPLNVLRVDPELFCDGSRGELQLSRPKLSI